MKNQLLGYGDTIFFFLAIVKEYIHLHYHTINSYSLMGFLKNDCIVVTFTMNP